MKKNIIFSSLLSLTVGLATTSCGNDMETLYTEGPDSVILGGDNTEINLSADLLDALVLTLYWNDNGSLTTSNPDIDAPRNTTQNTIELSAFPDFSTKHEIAVGAGVFEHQFVCRDLNGILTKLGYAPG
ncbi:MAG: hypothetical protein K2J63_04975, partial [Muribaculaceae bacterium]|nr:hypothetical protein [Muribaculaceae bacterium]